MNLFFFFFNIYAINQQIQQQSPTYITHLFLHPDELFYTHHMLSLTLNLLLIKHHLRQQTIIQYLLTKQHRSHRPLIIKSLDLGYKRNLGYISTPVFVERTDMIKKSTIIILPSFLSLLLSSLKYQFYFSEQILFWLYNTYNLL